MHSKFDSQSSARSSNGVIRIADLRLGDVFEFLQPTAPTLISHHGSPKSPMRVTIQPWGPKTKNVLVGPWLFACRDSRNIEFSYSLSPAQEVRLLSDESHRPPSRQTA